MRFPRSKKLLFANNKDHHQGTKENIEKSKEEFAHLSEELLKILHAY